MKKKESIWQDEFRLVLGLKNQEREAYAWLYDHYAGALYGVIKRIVENEDTANDLLQECFIKIWKQINQYDATKGKLFTWMINLTRNLCIDYLRSSGYKKEQANLNVEDHSPKADKLHQTQMKTDHIGLKDILLKLKDEQRVLIDKLYFEGYTHEEAALELEIPLGTVKTRIRSAILQLRLLIK